MYQSHKISARNQLLFISAGLLMALGFSTPSALAKTSKNDSSKGASLSEEIDIASETIQDAALRAFDVSADAADLQQETGAKDYQELEDLEELEEEAMQALIIGRDGGFDPELLAPFRGSLSQVHAELGYLAGVDRIAKSAPTGSALLDNPDVQKRLDDTSVLGLAKYDQSRVRAYLDFFDGRGKRTLAGWITRMGRFSPLILDALREADLPEDLIYVAMIESGFSPWARSPAAAVGLWQFIRSTGRYMGLRIDAYVDERRDPLRSTEAAAKYLKYLYDKFGSWPLALAAYNGGPGLVANTIDKYNSTDYWYICRQKGMYSETRRYVAKVIAAALVTKNADIFGLDMLAPDDAFSFDLVEVPPRTRLSLVAQATGSDVKTIKELNPALLTAQTPPGKDFYTLRIPAGSTDKFVQGFDKIQLAEGIEHITYQVKFGESLGMIGEKLKVPPRVLKAVNGLNGSDFPPIGMELIVPKNALDTWNPRKGKKAKKTILLPAETKDMKGKDRYFYRVQSGDTLQSVARGIGLNPADIVLWNHLDQDAKLQSGLYLQIFLADSQHAESVALAAEAEVEPIVLGSKEHAAWKKKQNRSVGAGRRWHTVRSGESLWTIARRYKVTVQKLKSWNAALRRSQLLQPGQRILVYPGR